jgi:hypothetical protein
MQAQFVELSACLQQVQAAKTSAEVLAVLREVLELLLPSISLDLIPSISEADTSGWSPLQLEAQRTALLQQSDDQRQLIVPLVCWHY